MAFCSNCGSRLFDGAAFCPECGTKQIQAGVAPQPATVRPAPPTPPVTQPQPTYQAPQQQQQTQYGAITFDVVEKETLKFLKAEFVNSAIRYESGGMYYMQGNLELEANLPSAGGFLKSMVTRESVVKPVISGSGTVWFEPSFGNFRLSNSKVKSGSWIKELTMLRK